MWNICFLRNGTSIKIWFEVSGMCVCVCDAINFRGIKTASFVLVTHYSPMPRHSRRASWCSFIGTFRVPDSSRFDTSEWWRQPQMAVIGSVAHGPTEEHREHSTPANQTLASAGAHLHSIAKWLNEQQAGRRKNRAQNPYKLLCVIRKRPTKRAYEP